MAVTFGHDGRDPPVTLAASRPDVMITPLASGP